MPTAGALGNLNLVAPSVGDDDIYAGVSDHAQAYLRQLNLSSGVTPPPLTMPQDITQLSDTELGQLFQQCAQWAGHCEAVLASFKAAHNVEQNRMDVLRAKIRVAAAEASSETRRKALTVQEKEDIVLTSPMYAKLSRSLVYYETLIRLAEPIVNSALRDYGTVSRRITQRGQEVNRDVRESMVSNMHTPMPMPMSQNGFMHRKVGP